MCKCANGRRLLRSYKTNLRENVQMVAVCCAVIKLTYVRMCKWSPFVAQL